VAAPASHRHGGAGGGLRARGACTRSCPCGRSRPS